MRKNIGNYGDNYVRRGRDSRYRGDDYLDRMAGEYGRYEESRSRSKRTKFGNGIITRL